MIESDTAWLRSLAPLRTLTEAEVHRIGRIRARESLTPAERQEHVSGHAQYGASRH